MVIHVKLLMLDFSKLSARLNKLKNKPVIEWTSDLGKDFCGLKGAFCRMAGCGHLYLDP